MTDDKRVRDVTKGMSKADARTMARIGKDMRDAITRAPGGDQVESRLRAFTMFAAQATASMGQPVVVSWCETQGVVHQCHADGKVSTMTTGAGDGH